MLVADTSNLGLIIICRLGTLCSVYPNVEGVVVVSCCRNIVKASIVLRSVTT
jgi:hypothetical protein